MPNHVTNRITVIKGYYDLESLKSFNDILPMPNSLEGTVSDSLAFEVEGAYSKNQVVGIKLKYFPSEEKLERILSLVDNLDKYGHATWYGWRTDNWGTKWDMYDRDYSNGVLTFETAWSAPFKVYEKLSKTLPEGVILKVECASEDLGQHSGVCYLSKYDFSNREYEQGSFEAMDLAVELKGMQDEFKYIDGEWVYLDELDEGGDFHE